MNKSAIFTIQDEITDRVAATLADNFGVLIRSMVASLEDSRTLNSKLVYPVRLSPEVHS